ncbi:DUF5655 domain-containing protein [Bacillus sp. CGMCC 1.16541]|uniref:DUF5655 domain-containing protein n=1 Tax=Bacillus sp. CGMCC 1.16541 TaxID=2185143 RepID=UPI000D73A304|nr:DUF5655 domain-containing protein [Bacillus sp. CGMCC 1.16541]
MGDIKLFSINQDTVEELIGSAVTIEKSLQTLIEKHLDAFLGVRFLASEYSTGKTHAGRIDTLGLDENNCPVIIEYKRSMNENVINQGLFYLDWLLDHKGEFTLLVLETFGKDVSDNIDWSSPRLLCIAGSFTKYDSHAVQQINRNIELYQYKKYGDSLFMLDLVNATTAQGNEHIELDSSVGKKGGKSKTASELLDKANTDLTDLFEHLRSFMLALGDDVQMKTLKHYFAFKRIKNFACVEVIPGKQKLLAYLKVNPDEIALEEGFSRDVRNIGHYGTGDLEVTIQNEEDMEKAKKLIVRSYDLS